MDFIKRLTNLQHLHLPPNAQPTVPKLAYILKHRDKFSPKNFPSRPANDTPLATLYRIYIAIAAGLTIQLRNEIQYFSNHHTWSVAAIPEPCDYEAERKAILAAITYLLVKAINRNVGMGLPRDTPPVLTDNQWDEVMARPKVFETVPAWAEQLKPLKDTLVLPDANGKVLKSKSDDDADHDMLRKNILITILPVLFT